ncbi:MAG: glycosyltransferase [Solirubrobacterales bacterium]|nr:glycosyltransferase [Solirubrobacterales bacterium]OJU96169.1 MAG: hypothetical protein BGO23_01205 [Solirubrobacterales bacterium 67-14]
MADRGLLALPMHGEVKLRQEGYRTRDGHLLEWIGRLRPELAVSVRSRPEPFPRVSLARRHGHANPAWDWQSPQPLTVPPLRAKRAWWVRSLRHEPAAEGSYEAAIVWNPLAGAHLLAGPVHAERVVVDLLDDWSLHIAFEPVRDEVEQAYARIFELADAITANSEGTMRLAARFGRDAELIPNGCDPEKFALPGDRRGGGKTTVGYAGKLSERLDPELIVKTAAELPEVRFEIAGPFATASRAESRRIRDVLKGPENIHLLGDVPYEDLPNLISAWDIGWVPHRVGAFEVGGDAIKIYEYRAAGLPVLTAAIIGTERAPAGVSVFEGVAGAIARIRRLTGADPHPARIPIRLPDNMTWRAKASRLLELAGF